MDLGEEGGVAVALKLGQHRLLAASLDQLQQPAMPLDVVLKRFVPLGADGGVESYTESHLEVHKGSTIISMSSIGHRLQRLSAALETTGVQNRDSQLDGQSFVGMPKGDDLVPVLLAEGSHHGPDGRHVPQAPFQRYDQVFNDPHLLARGFFWDAPHPRLGTVHQLGNPMRFSVTPVRRERGGPLFGEDSVVVLHELGYDDDEIQRLLRARVIATPAQAAEARA